MTYDGASEARETGNHIGAAGAYERAGRWESAAVAYRAAYRAAVASKQAAELVGAIHGIARVHRQQGRFEEAEEMTELCRHVAERHHLPQAAARATTTLAILRYCEQAWAAAQALYGEALQIAQDCDDSTLVGTICQNRGVIHNIQGSLREARVCYLESVAASTRAQDRPTAMLAYNNLGMVCADLREWTEAEVYFSRGVDLAEQLGNRVMLAKLYANRAEPLLCTGELARAEVSLDRAGEIASETGDRELRPVIARFRAMIARERRQLRVAEQHLTDALSLAEELPLDRAEVLEELGRLRREQGRNEEAVAALREARDGFIALGAARDAERVAEILDGWEGESIRTS